MLSCNFLSEYITEARANRQRNKKSDYKIIRSEISYPAYIVNAEHNEERAEMVITFVVFTTPAGIRREISFRMNTAASYYYDEICNIIGTNGDPNQLIGKSVMLHFEDKNGFQNVRVEVSITQAELNEFLTDMEPTLEEPTSEEVSEIRPKKKVKKKKVKKVIQDGEHREIQDNDVDIL